jgi:hypothetical protein
MQGKLSTFWLDKAKYYDIKKQPLKILGCFLKFLTLSKPRTRLDWHVRTKNVPAHNLGHAPDP